MYEATPHHNPVQMYTGVHSCFDSSVSLTNLPHDLCTGRALMTVLRTYVVCPHAHFNDFNHFVLHALLSGKGRGSQVWLGHFDRGGKEASLTCIKTE